MIRPRNVTATISPKPTVVDATKQYHKPLESFCHIEIQPFVLKAAVFTLPPFYCECFMLFLRYKQGQSYLRLA